MYVHAPIIALLWAHTNVQCSILLERAYTLTARWCKFADFSVCQTIHRINIRSGGSIMVNKRCALPSECTVNMIGCQESEVPGVQVWRHIPPLDERVSTTSEFALSLSLSLSLTPVEVYTSGATFLIFSGVQCHAATMNTAMSSHLSIWPQPSCIPTWKTRQVSSPLTQERSRSWHWQWQRQPYGKISTLAKSNGSTHRACNRQYRLDHHVLTCSLEQNTLQKGEDKLPGDQLWTVSTLVVDPRCYEIENNSSSLKHIQHALSSPAGYKTWGYLGVTWGCLGVTWGCLGVTFFFLFCRKLPISVYHNAFNKNTFSF